MDLERRELERRAVSGDQSAAVSLYYHYQRVSEPFLSGKIPHHVEQVETPLGSAELHLILNTRFWAGDFPYQIVVVFPAEYLYKNYPEARALNWEEMRETPGTSASGNDPITALLGNRWDHRGGVRGWRRWLRRNRGIVANYMENIEQWNSDFDRSESGSWIFLESYSYPLEPLPTKKLLDWINQWASDNQHLINQLEDIWVGLNLKNKEIHLDVLEQMRSSAQTDLAKLITYQLSRAYGNYKQGRPLEEIPSARYKQVKYRFTYDNYRSLIGQSFSTEVNNPAFPECNGTYTLHVLPGESEGFSLLVEQPRAHPELHWPDLGGVPARLLEHSCLRGRGSILPLNRFFPLLEAVGLYESHGTWTSQTQLEPSPYDDWP